MGSASLSTNASGGKLTDMRYYPYGETRSGTLATDRRYTGQRQEIGLGLYDYNARYYDPYLSRFISPDLIVPEPQKPRDLNRYAYAANNPLSFIDPNGHQIKPPTTCDGICYTGTTGPYNVEYASPAAQPLTVGTTQSSNDYYWTMPSKLPNDAGVIMRYQTHFEAVPKIAVVYAPCVQGPELQTVWRYESGQWTRSQEIHFAVGVDAGGVSIGVDSYNGKTSPELGIGPVTWSGNEVVFEGKIPLNSGVEAGIEYGGAGDFFVITTGEKLNEMGVNGIQQRYVQRDSLLLGYEVYENYSKAWSAFWPRNLAQQRWTGFPYTWRSTEME